MIIKGIDITGFGKFNDRAVYPAQGFNLIYGGNEDGKTTLMSFLKMMFYSSSSKSEKSSDLFKSLRKKYRPWNGGTMAGAVEFESGGMEYRLQKEFLKSEASDKTTIFCKTTGEEVLIDRPNEAGIHFFGMTLEEFERSVFIGQLGGFEDEGTTDSLAMRISNLSVSGDQNISQDKILKRLSDAAEELLTKSRKKGLLVEAENKLEDLKMKEQDAIRLEEEHIDIQVKISKAEAEVAELEEKLNSIVDGERFESAKKELNAYYALRNKLNLLNTVKKQLADYNVSEDGLREYIREAELLNDEIEESLNMIQECTEGQTSATLTDDEYYAINQLSIKAENLRQDLTYIREKVAISFDELGKKTNTAIKVQRIIYSLLFVVVAIVLTGIVYFRPEFTYLGVGAIGVSALIYIFAMLIIKKTATKKLSVQLAKRDYKDSLKTIFSFNEDMLSKTPAEIEAYLRESLAEVSTTLDDSLARYNCDGLEQLKKLSAAALTEDISILSDKLANQKNMFVKLAEQIRPVKNYSAAKILYVELAESLKSLTLLNAEIDSICSLAEIKDIEETTVENKIKALVSFVAEIPEKSNENQYSADDLRSQIKEKRIILNELLNSIKRPERSLSEIRKEIEAEEKKIKKYKTRLAEINIAQEVMNEAIIDTNKGLGSSLSEKVGVYLAEISSGDYSEVMVPRNLNIEARSNDGAFYHDWKYFSSGAIDRLYLALRLAITDIIVQDNEQMPLLFDDIFTQYDDEACMSALTFLKKYLEEGSSASQIMFFTCHKHIADMAKKVFGNLNEISL